MKIWHESKKEFVETPKDVSNFIDEIVEVCKKYKLSISHEDEHGSFIIGKYFEDDITWFKNASIK